MGRCAPRARSRLKAKPAERATRFGERIPCDTWRGPSMRRLAETLFDWANRIGSEERERGAGATQDGAEGTALRPARGVLGGGSSAGRRLGPNVDERCIDQRQSLR